MCKQSKRSAGMASFPSRLLCFRHTDPSVLSLLMKAFPELTPEPGFVSPQGLIEADNCQGE